MISLPWRRCGALAALLGAGVPAQTIPTTPVQNATTEGLTLSLAVANPTYQRTQVIYESNVVYRPLALWSALLLRPDGSAWPYPAFQRNLTLRLSGRGVPSPEQASQSSFAANYGTDLTTVLDNKPVSFPAHASGGSGPAPFLVTIPLEQPFSMLGTAHMLVEIETPAIGGGPSQWLWPLDAEQWLGRPWTVIADPFGSGCGPAQGWSVAYDPVPPTLTTTLRWTRPIGAPPTHPAVAWLGLSNSQWGPLPLPLPLTLLGAPGCALLTEPTLTWLGQTGGGSGESFTLRLPVPRNYGLFGRSVYSQTMVFDQQAGNPAGVRLSPGARFFFSSPPDPYHAITLTRRGSPGDQPSFVEPDRAPVLGVQ